MEYTSDNITELAPNEVFVFGSNLAGRHGKGAAEQAKKWGALYGKARGRMGQTYAIPTKDFTVEKALPLPIIETMIWEFLQHAKSHPEDRFLVTRIGCGWAGYTPQQVGYLFQKYGSLPNVILPKDFYKENV